ncbi:three-Cys-motif partner protein TcmP [Catellatospora citrea]|nr:three-Cys-motif partner protein TcmP [Catellatospora citrea]
MDPHTQAKHELLKTYLGGWFPILSTYNGRIVFLDGFAGPGRYKGGQPGSPLIALETLLDHSYFPSMTQREFLFIFCEPHKGRADNLRAELQDLVQRRAPWPKNVKFDVIDDDFEGTARSILATLATQKANLAPTFAFVDPFGVSGLPMEVLANLMAFDRCELFVNYMVNPVVRFATAENIDDCLKGLFGTTEFLKAPAQGREKFLHDLYERQLKDVCKFSFVRSFGMKNKTGNTIYYLFYGTRSLKGLEIMKDAMWKIDPGGGYRFSDRLAGQDILFTEEDLIPGPLRNALASRFKNTTVTIAQIEEFVLVETPYRKAHIRKQALTPMEKARTITVKRPGRSGFPPGTTVTF